MKDKTSKDILLQGKSNKGLYEFSTSSPQVHIHTKSASFDIWHARLGHPRKAVVSSIISQHNLPVSAQLILQQFVLLVI